MRSCNALLLLALAGVPAMAAVQTYGDIDLLGTGDYPTDPTTGATLEGLAPDVVTFGMPAVGHDWGFTPEFDDFPGTDQIYVGSTQTNFWDGYSGEDSRLPGPQVFNIDYAGLVPAGQAVVTLTLGIGADDFQYVPFGQPFVATMNGEPALALSAVLNGLDQTGPVAQFFTIGVDPSVLDGSHAMTLTIDEGGDGGDGWAVDFLTIGVTTDGTVDAGERPAGLSLAQNAPNPFNPATTVRFSVPETSAARLLVHALTGELVREQDLGVVARGEHEVVVDGSDLASGVYVYTLRSEFGNLSRKMVLMK